MVPLYLQVIGSSLLVLSNSCEAFLSTSTTSFTSSVLLAQENGWDMTRRESIGKGFLATLFPLVLESTVVPPAMAADAPGFIQEYDDFIKTSEGWSFRDVKVGKGSETAQEGDRVVFDWSGYTIGYFGRPFQAKGGPQGGAFDKDIDYERTVIGSGKVVKGLECALQGMLPGGIRQVVVPYGPYSYPADDLPHDRVGPKPTTFSGVRALNFVLENPRVDRTMLFNVKVIRIDKADGKGGFIRG